MVPPTGLEPVQGFPSQILSLMRMPISPRRQIFKVDRKNNWQNSRPTLLFNFQKAVNPQYTIIRGIWHPKSSTDFKSLAFACFATAANIHPCMQKRRGGAGFACHNNDTIFSYEMSTADSALQIFSAEFCTNLFVSDKKYKIYCKILSFFTIKCYNEK